MTLFQRLQESHSSDTPDYLVIGAKQGFVMSKIYIYIYIYIVRRVVYVKIFEDGEMCADRL